MDPELLEYHKKTERELASFRKQVEKDLVEWRSQIGQQLHDLSTDTRTRLARGETERDKFYVDARFSWTEMNRKLDRAISLAEATNGKVTKHEAELSGPDGTGGIKKQVSSLLDSRTWMTVLLGFICTLTVIWWTVWGSEVKARGLVNKTEQEEIELINKQIWKLNNPGNGNVNGNGNGNGG